MWKPCSVPNCRCPPVVDLFVHRLAFAEEKPSYRLLLDAAALVLKLLLTSAFPVMEMAIIDNPSSRQTRAAVNTLVFIYTPPLSFVVPICLE